MSSHGIRVHRRRADHRDAEQWHFFAVAENDLPGNESIKLSALRELVSPCGFGELKEVVEEVYQSLSDLKSQHEKAAPARKP